MTCRELSEFIVDYRSGNLSPEVHTDFEEHLVNCAGCLTYLRSYEETIRLAKGAYAHPEDPLPADVPEQLVQAILAARTAKRH
jgi:anti-sigma factor RsiW